MISDEVRGAMVIDQIIEFLNFPLTLQLTSWLIYNHIYICKILPLNCRISPDFLAGQFPVLTSTWWIILYMCFFHISSGHSWICSLQNLWTVKHGLVFHIQRWDLHDQEISIWNLIFLKVRARETLYRFSFVFLLNFLYDCF